MATQALKSVDLADCITVLTNYLEDNVSVAIARAWLTIRQFSGDGQPGALDTHTSMEIMDLFERFFLRVIRSLVTQNPISRLAPIA